MQKNYNKKAVLVNNKHDLIVEDKILLLFHAKTFVETFNTTTGIYQFLSSGKERVTTGANINVDIFFGGFSFKLVTTCTFNNGGFIIRMDSFLHDESPLYKKFNSQKILQMQF